ncbi:hypothetical protein D3C77_784800 [compost metagenome]
MGGVSQRHVLQLGRFGVVIVDCEAEGLSNSLTVGVDLLHAGNVDHQRQRVTAQLY